MADDYKVTVRIGAGLDARSFDATLGDAQKRAQKAATAIAKTTVTAERQGSRERVESARSAEREIASENRRQLAVQRAAMKQFNAEWKKDAKEAARVELSEKRQAHREAMMIVNAEQRAKRGEIQKTQQAEREANRERERFAFRTSQRATRFLFPRPEGMLGYGRRVGHDVMRGVGMDWSLAEGLQRNRQNEAIASQISNQGWVPGEGGDFKNRISKDQVRENSQAIAKKYAFSENEVSEGTQAYINLTGDLKGALPLMDKLALLSRATGTNLSDAAQAAADMSVQFEGLPDKGKRVADMLGIAAMQGKTGALELFQIAKQMPRIVSLAGFFAGDKSTSMANLLAGAQITRRYTGGTAAMVATQTQGMVMALEKGGKKFVDDKGKNFARDAKGNLLSLPELVAKSVQVSSKGGKFDSTKFFGMWEAVRGGKLAMAGKQIYDKAGGGEAGVQAIIAEFSKFTKGLNPADQEKLAGAAVDTQERRAQLFQQQLDKVARNLQADLLPSLEQLEPHIVELAQAFSGLVSFVASHLPSAIMLAITASIARAGIESGFRMGIDRMLGASSPAMGQWNAGFKTFGGGLMTTAQLMGTFAIAVGSTMAALELLNTWIEGKAGKGSKALNELDENLNASLANVDANTNFSPEEKAAAKADLVRRAQKRLAYDKEEAGMGGYSLTQLGATLTGNEHYKQVSGAYSEQEGKYQGMAEGLEQEAALRKRYGANGASTVGSRMQGAAGITPGLTNEGIAQALVNALAGQTLNTNIKNAHELRNATANVPTVDPNHRTPPAGSRPP